MTLQPCRIVLVDDHARLRQEVRRLLCEAETFEIVGEAENGLELFNLLASSVQAPDLVILELSMPAVSGIETLQRMKASYPGIKVLILTRHEEEIYLRYAFSNGAEGYVVKEDAATELLPAINAIRNGREYVSSFFSKLGEEPARSEGDG